MSAQTNPARRTHKRGYRNRVLNPRPMQTEMLEHRWLLTGGITFHPPEHLGAGSQTVWTATANMDGDGLADLVWANKESDKLSVRLARSAGQFSERRLLFPARQGIVSATTGDIDGDGDRDMVVVANGVNVLLNNGLADGRWAGLAAPVYYAAGIGPTSLAPADFDCQRRYRWGW